MTYPHEAPVYAAMMHFIISLLPYFRYRLRCPACEGVGTFKSHGSVFDHEDTRKVRRWLCKWCGYYYYRPEGRQQAVLTQSSDNRLMWELEVDALKRCEYILGLREIGTPQYGLRFRFEYYLGCTSAPNPWRG